MAEATVESALRKLANIIMKEIEFTGGVGEILTQVQRELTQIRYFVKDAESRGIDDVMVKIWLNELCDVAYSIEDTIDMFFLEYDDNYHKNPSFLQKFKNLCNKPPKMPTLHNLRTELENINNKLEGISKRRVDYGIKALQDILEEAIRMPVRRATYQEVDEAELVGMHADKNKIMELLRPETTLRRAIITIVGMGGIGKTTLAHVVYKRARADFDYHIMLSISQTFHLTDLLRKLLHQINDSVSGNQEVGNLINELRSFLINRRYLIILDDVWIVDLWNQLKNALPDVKNGSRVLMTSRSIDVALSADPIMAPYELNVLDDRYSLDLLLRKALPYQEPNEDCPSDLLELACELSKKCKGLPLTLTVVGGILSTKELNYYVWKRVLQTMNRHSDGMAAYMNVLTMSYHDMPYYLKPCFLYFASFPEDHVISAQCLIRMWIAEGFIPHNEKTALEESAEEYLEEFFRRSMIQVSSRSTNGLIKSCKVQNLMRSLAIHEAQQNNSVTVISPESDFNQPDREIRRVSLQYPLEIESMEYAGPNIRSILMFEVDLPLPNFSNFRLLKVLVLERCGSYNGDQVYRLDELVNLQYLALKNCRLILAKCSFRSMKALQTLEVRGITELPSHDTLWTIGTLRHVVSDRSLYGPPSSADLRNLVTLQTVCPSRTWGRKLPLLNNLRKLGLINQFDDWVKVTNLLQVLPSLVSLAISGRINIPMEIIYPKVLPNYQNLQSLYLGGNWSETVTLEASSFPPHLIKLTLNSPFFKQNPMPELGKLKSLKKLCFMGRCFMYDGPTIFQAGFPVLQYLKVDVWDQYSNNFTVAQGVMPKLTYIVLSPGLKLHMPLELQHVTIDRH